MDKSIADFNAAAIGRFASGAALQHGALRGSCRCASRCSVSARRRSAIRRSQYALQQRFGSRASTIVRCCATASRRATSRLATIVAADIKSTPEAIIAEARSSKQTLVDVANAHGMHAWPLEIFTGFVYLDYTDDPDEGNTPGRRHGSRRRCRSSGCRRTSFHGLRVRRARHLSARSEGRRRSRRSGARAQTVPLSALRRSRR